MRASFVVLGVLFLFTAASGSALAQQPAASPTVTASGYGSAKPDPVDRNSEKSIVAAVERAEKAALPLAVKEARERATQIAQAAGLTLGQMISIGDSPTSSPYGPFGFYPVGTFGPGKFCGLSSGFRVTRDKDGRIRRKRVKRHRICRVPPRVQTTVTVTFATVAPTPAS